jgi:hypothetical protein
MRVGPALALALVLAAVSSVSAQEPGLALVEVGFAGHARPGAWTPLWVDVTAAGTDLDAVVVVVASTPLGQPAAQFATPVRAAAGARVRVFVPAIFFDARTPGVVRLERGGVRLASVSVPRLSPVEEIALVLSDEPLTLEAAAARVDGLDVAYAQSDRLPPVWQAYETVRVLVVRTLDDRRLDDRQRRALRDWLWTGGRLIVMPSGDDARHLRGPTLGPLRDAAATGALGRGRLSVWTVDAAGRDERESAVIEHAWEAALAGRRTDPPPPLDGTLPAGRPVPPRVYGVIGVLVALYVLGVRRMSRWLATLRPVAVAGGLVALLLVTAGAARLAVYARGEASGVVSATVVEAIPGTVHGLLWMQGRTVSSHAGPFEVAAGAGIMLRPLLPAPLVLTWAADGMTLAGRGAPAEFSGIGLVPLAISGTFESGGGRVSIVNASGQPLEDAWILARGRVQRLPPVGERLEHDLHEAGWQAHERLPRVDGRHALLVWAFSRVGGDAILKATPAWLVGWWRDSSLALRWDGRVQAPLQLVLVPLTARP